MGENMLNKNNQKSDEKVGENALFDSDQTDKHNKQVAEIEKAKEVRVGTDKAKAIREKIDGVAVHGDQIFNEEQQKEFEKKRTLGVGYTNDVKDILKYITKSSESSKIVALNNYIRLGDVLYDAKAHLGMHFTAFITEEMISAKQTQRYIKLIIKKKSEKTYSRLRKAGKEDFSKIEKDTRITGLNEKNISTMVKPSMAKIMRMKELSDTDFTSCIQGDESEYLTLEQRDRKKSRENNRKEIEAKQPDGMDDDVYKEFLKHGIHYVLEQYQILENIHEKLMRDNAEKDETLSSFDNVLSRMAGAKLYTGSSQPENEEQKQLETATH